MDPGPGSDDDHALTPTNEADRSLGSQSLDITINGVSPPAVSTTADQVEITIVSQAPPHPQAAGVPPLTLQLSRPKLKYKFPSEDAIPITMPTVLSKAPPHKRLLTMTETDSSADEDEMCDGVHLTRMVFEVKVCVREKEEVRITGNTPSLGSWDIFNSVKLSKSTERDDVWSVRLEVPFERPIKYRYLVTRPVPSSEGIFNIVSWETFLAPRRCILKKPRSIHSEDIHKDSVEYGIIGDDFSTKHIDDGWLVGTSELHLQLGTLEKALSISDHPLHTHYLLTLTPFTQAHSEAVNCSPLKAKLCSRSKGDCVTFDLGSGGCPYDQLDNLVIFTTESVNFQHTGFVIDVFRVSKQCGQSSSSLPVSLPPASSRVGRASLLPQHYLHGESRGTVVLTLFSEELLPVGTLSLCFLLIDPVSDLPLLHSTKHTYSNYWRQHKRMLYIGHRGLGDSHHSKLRATETENTIASLKMAGTHGADYVEFDVHLTRDQVCVVYHNFLVATTLAREGFFSGELYSMAVKDLTLSQLQSFKLENSNCSGNKVEIPCHCSSKHCCSDESDYARSTSQLKDTHTAVFPTLEVVFQSVPTSLGFNIEVKYPLPERAKDGSVGEDYSCFDINLMADIILRVVDQHAGERAVIFSCFNPDMCTVLRRKQSKYPVMFLTSCLNPIYDDPLDYRAHTLQDAMMHASAEKLPGIIADSYILVDQIDLVREVKERGFVLFTWGDTNNSIASIEAQERGGVDAVIYDCIDQLLPSGSTTNGLQRQSD